MTIRAIALLLVVAFAATGQDPAIAPAQSFSTDREALVALYHATVGPNWINSANWLTDAPFGEWHGITTDDAGRVTELRLPENGLSGEIPPELGGLANLRVAELSGNHLGRALPPEVGRLAGLEVLDLNQNQLTGTVPSALGRLGSLEVLDLSGNLLRGAIPPELGRLLVADRPGLVGNRLSAEPAPDLTGLAMLRVLNLSANQLRETIPATLGHLTNLPGLYLGGSNQLTGCIPAELRDVKQGDIPALGLPFCEGG